MNFKDGFAVLGDFAQDPTWQGFPPWAGRIWYGSVFGTYGLVGATGVFLSIVKHGRFQIFLAAYWLALLALAAYSLWLAFTQHPPAKDL